MSDHSFEGDVIKSTLPVLVVFGAEWCPPYRMITSMLSSVAGEYEGKIAVGKMDIDENVSEPARLGVRGIPVLMVFKNGEVVATKEGALNMAQLKAFIDAQL